ncbi:MAG: CapA family protein [Solimonas sp.]
MRTANSCLSVCLLGAASAAAPAAFGAKADRAWQSAGNAKDETVFVLTGDSIINRRLSAYEVPGKDAMFDLVRGADAAFTNFETLIHPYDMPGATESGGTYMASPPFVADELEWAGFDLLGVANNHGNDYGAEGLLSTLDALSKTRLIYAGAGKNLAFARAPGYLDTRKGRVALISATSSFPSAIRAGAQRKDLPGRPGINPLGHEEIYTVTQQTFDSLKPMGRSMTVDGQETLHIGDATFAVGAPVGVVSKADARDMEELAASVRDARQQADWVMVSVHSHESKVAGDPSKPADFLVEFAHAMIDAGADVVVGHGPHVLRGIEIYKGKPIFYSMGNFIFENDLVAFQPADNYEKTDLAESALPGDYYSKRSKNDTVGFPAGRKFWQTVIAELVFKDDRTLETVKLRPVALGFGRPRPRRGQPYPATGDEAKQILDDITELSAPYGTKITVRDGVGFISLKSD